MSHVLAAAAARVALPAALVDLDAFDANVDHFVAVARRGGKKLRIATKSIRVPALLERVRDRAGDVYGGLMTFTAAETAWLAGLGWRDLLLAYPTAAAEDAALLAGTGARVVADDAAQLAVLGAAARASGATIPVVVELDVAYRRLGLHLGARRSPLHGASLAIELVSRVVAEGGLAFDGIMAYEAQIAGLADGPAVRAMKRLSAPDVRSLRAATVAALAARGWAPNVVNGAGTGNASQAADEPALTELTVGSGFLAGHLFDGYDGLALRPALHFALQAVRRPAPELVTCHGGGYVASGAPAPDRLPIVVHPAGATLLSAEGAGEVQTPVRLPPGAEVALGAPVLFRPAKSGELAERFNEYVLVAPDGSVERVPTYRGLGRCFL